MISISSLRQLRLSGGFFYVASSTLLCYDLLHIFYPAEYLGMSGKCRNSFLEVSSMCNNGLCGGNLCWIIILLVLFCGCGNNSWMGNNNCGCGCDRNSTCC